MAGDNRALLTVKVMRLSQPSVDAYPWTLLRHEEALFTKESPKEDLHRERMLVNKTPDSCHSLLLPESQGQIFSGECFSAYINLLNASNTKATDIVLQVDILKGQKRNLLFDNSQHPLPLLNPGDFFDCTTSYQLVEQGAYTLGCSISYVGSGTEQKHFRKSFKFVASPPLKVCYKIVHMPGRAFVECSLGNVSEEPLLLRNTSVLCEEGIEGVRLETPDQQNNASCKDLHYFKPHDTYNIIFCLTPTTAQMNVDDAYLKRLSLFGRLIIDWRTSTGGVGSSLEYLLENDVQYLKDLNLRVVACPATVDVESEFQVEIEVSVQVEGHHVKPDLVLLPDELEPFIIQGTLRRHLHTIDAQTPRRYTLNVMCLSPGLHSLKGVYVQDPESHQRTDPTESLCQILAF